MLTEQRFVQGSVVSVRVRNLLVGELYCADRLGLVRIFVVEKAC